MTTLALFAAAGAVSWILRAAFTTLVPARYLPASLTATLRYASPAAFASLLAVALSGGSAGPAAASWQSFAAAAVAACVAWRWRNLTATVVAGGVAISLLTLW